MDMFVKELTITNMIPQFTVYIDANFAELVNAGMIDYKTKDHLYPANDLYPSNTLYPK